MVVYSPFFNRYMSYCLVDRCSGDLQVGTCLLAIKLLPILSHTSTGAKLITPFGLLGACSTRSFKRRLREHYHRPESTISPYASDAAETMRLGAFLRDFVIEFGPAEAEHTSGHVDSEAQHHHILNPQEFEHSEM